MHENMNSERSSNKSIQPTRYTRGWFLRYLRSKMSCNDKTLLIDIIKCSYDMVLV